MIVNEEIRAARPIKLEDRVKHMTEKNPLIAELRKAAGPRSGITRPGLKSGIYRWWKVIRTETRLRLHPYKTKIK